MIITEIFDGQGHGNQLWCYVVTRVIALDAGVPFGIAHPERMKCASFMRLDFGLPVAGGAVAREAGVPLSLPEGIRYYYTERKIEGPQGVDIRTHDEGLVSVPDGTKIDGIMQDERYIAHRKDEIREWLKLNEECLEYASDDICVIYIRGGEYKAFSNVFLHAKYWNDAVAHMRTINPQFRFVVVTDDNRSAQKFFPDFEILDFAADKDYAIIASAHYVITANSSFAFFPLWLNQRLKMVIAPKYWAAHNTSDGYWGCSYNIVDGWTYQDRDGKLHDSASCKKEFEVYMAKHSEYFGWQKTSATLVVSNNGGDLGWVPRHADSYVIYDVSASPILPPSLNHTSVHPSSGCGRAVDYLTYIIEQYDSLPETIAFMRGIAVPDHMSETYFAQASHAKKFCMLYDPTRHAPQRPIAYVGKDGAYREHVRAPYLAGHPTKYFPNYESLARFVFERPATSQYIAYAPGANYIVPKSAILRHPKAFYENLRMFASHTPGTVTGEALIIERLLAAVWNDSHDASAAMRERLDPSFVAPRTTRTFAAMLSSVVLTGASLLFGARAKIGYVVRKFPRFLQYLTGARPMTTLWTRPEIAKIARVRTKLLALHRRLHKLRIRYLFMFKNWLWLTFVWKQPTTALGTVRLKEAMLFPLLESDALQAKCDYSFGAHSGVLGHVPGAYMKKANHSNKEFTHAVRTHTGPVMTLFIDNVRLYRRPLAYADWLHMKPLTAPDRAWLDAMADEDLLELCASFPEKKFVIFTALEDIPLDEHIEGRIPENVLSINAANAVYFGGKIRPWPHALERKMFPGYNHHAILRRYMADDRLPTKLLYVNHRNDTGNRGSLYALFSDKPWATVSQRTYYARYLAGIQAHKFVLCPSGNGIESARNWETLYMRRVPVFKRHPCLEELFKDFPAVFVDDWSEVTEDLLKKNEHLYDKALTTDMKKLNLDLLFANRLRQ